MSRTATVDVALLVLTAVIYAAIGVWALVDPTGLLAEVGVRPDTPGGTVELRAMYGGLQLGIAAFLVGCAARPGWRLPGLVAAAASVAGIGTVRAVSLVLTRPDETLLYGFAALELTGAAIGIGWIVWTSGGRSS